MNQDDAKDEVIRLLKTDEERKMDEYLNYYCPRNIWRVGVVCLVLEAVSVIGLTSVALNKPWPGRALLLAQAVVLAASGALVARRMIRLHKQVKGIASRNG